MTREEAINRYYDVSLVRKKNNNQMILDNLKDFINKIYDDFEKQNSCDGCKNKPKKGDNYPMKCGVCRRFYGDMYEYES